MIQFALRLPNSLHGYAKEVAQQDQTSLNQFIVTAVAEKLSAMRTEEFFRERAAKAKPSRLDKILTWLSTRSHLPSAQCFHGFVFRLTHSD